MTIARLPWGALLLAGGLVVSATPGLAQQACLQLESQLAALERQNSQAVYESLQSQYAQARARYDQAYVQAQQAGCIRIFRFQIPDSCGPTLAQLESLRAQYESLQAQLQSANPGQALAARNNILRALAANDCGPQYTPFANQQNGGLLNRLFGLPQAGPAIGDALIPLVTTYRTICVRACDGYFFPLSFSTTPSNFATDERACQAQCPGAALYYYENPGAPVETAVSLNGQPYTSLENAFAYRESYNPECGCEPATSIAEEATFSPIPPETVEIIAAVGATVPIPERRPEPTEDPETIANRLGEFEPGAFALGEAELNALLVSEDGLRLIGPAYLYVQ